MNTEAEMAAEALNAIPTPTGDDWLKISMAYKAAGGDYSSWDMWCKQGENYNEAENLQRWQSIKPGAIRAGTLFHYARLSGWMPQRKAAPVYVGSIPKPTAAPKKKATPPRPGAKATAAAYIKAALENAPAAAVYLKQRGIINAPAGFTFGWDNQKQGLVIVYPGQDYYVMRRTSIEPNAKTEKGKPNKYEYPAGLEKPVFNAGVFDEETAYITEGQIDAITLNLAGFPAAACNTPAALIDAIQGRKVKNIFYVADADETGQDKAQKITEAVKAAGINAQAITLPAHDVNALFLDAYNHAPKGEEEEAAVDALKQAIAAAKVEAAEYERQQKEAELEAITAGTVAAHLDAIRERCKNPVPPISTGFPVLDGLLNGGIRAGELTVLGGESSSGKTTLAMQIIDHAAAAGYDCIVFSAEMSESDIVARSVSRESSEMRAAGIRGCAWEFSQREVQDERKFMQPGMQNALKSLENAWKSYISYSGYITIVQNEGENMTPTAIANYVKRYCAATGRRPFVLVDYLQYLPPDDGSVENVRANTDAAVRTLKTIAVTHALPLLVISSLSRNNYCKPLTMAAFKESGGIEYSAELLMGLQFHCVHEIEGQYKKDGTPVEAVPPTRIKAEKRKPIRDVEITILKQRGGCSSGYCRFDYDAKHNRFFNDEPFEDASPDMAAADRERMKKDTERQAKEARESKYSCPAPELDAESAEDAPAEPAAQDETKAALANFKAKKAKAKAAKPGKQAKESTKGEKPA